MGIFDRLKRILSANINDAITQAEDPEKMLHQISEELNADLIQVKTQVASAIAIEKQLSQRARQAQEEADKWQQKAELAVDRNEDELAREALKRRATAQQTADSFRQQWEEQKKSVALLKENYAQLESKIAETRTKKDLLIARHRRAEAEKRIQQTLGRAGTSDAMSAFDRMEARVLDKESQAAAFGELNRDSLEDRFAALGSGPAVDDELALLKAARNKSIGSGSSQGLLESGDNK